VSRIHPENKRTAEMCPEVNPRQEKVVGEDGAIRHRFTAEEA
jgi:hypothetical protein